MNGAVPGIATTLPAGNETAGFVLVTVTVVALSAVPPVFRSVIDSVPDSPSSTKPSSSHERRSSLSEALTNWSSPPHS